jgi:nucleotide-binding universal stress UspA family protein
MSRVLLPASNHSRWARDVADVLVETEEPDTTAVVAHVFDEEELASTRANLDLDGRPTADELAARKSGVSAAVDRIETADMDCEVRGFEHDGEPAGAIVDAVDETDADRLYMYSRRRSPAGKAVFGSTLQTVLLNAAVPVVVTPSNV